ncbi:SBBP repeat-containing protein, partial [Hymenobacter agri]
RRAVACRYVLAEGSTVRFALGAYDHARALTIDPVVVFASYSGSAANNWGFTATYDPAGNLYTGGIAFDIGYPTTAGAFQTTFKALVDIAIIKFNTNVSGPAARVWATYLGGNDADFPTSLVVNSQGELLVLGTSGSDDFPVTAAAAQRRFASGVAADPFGFGAPYDAPNGTDLVITRLNATGTALRGSTYLGGSGNEGLLPLAFNTSASSPTPQLAHNYGDPFRGDILVDAADNVYVASHTTSANFPVAAGLGGAYRGGTSDGVVVKLAPALDAV